MRYSLYIFLLISLFISCADEENSSGNKGATTETEKTEATDNSTIGKSSTDEDRWPLIDQVEVDFKDGVYYVETELIGKDANYYNAYADPAHKFSIVLEGTHPYTQLIIINPEGKMLLQRSVVDGKLEWEGSFNTAGKVSFLVGIQGGKAEPTDKSQVRFTLKRQ